MYKESDSYDGDEEDKISEYEDCACDDLGATSQYCDF